MKEIISLFRRLKWPLVVGLGLRLVYVAVSEHIYYPDEIFQSLEQSLRLLTGFGALPWEYAHGVRSLLLPVVLMPGLWLARVISQDPAVYTKLMTGGLAAASLILVPAGYFLGKRITGKTESGILAAWGLAIWYELIYLAPRALAEVVAVDMLAAGVVVLGVNKKTGSWWEKLGLGILMIGIYLRPQYAVVVGLVAIALKVGWAWWRCNRLWLVAVIVVLGLFDKLTMGRWWIGITAQVKYSLLSDISHIFGTEPWWFYGWALVTASTGLWLVGLVQEKNETRKQLTWGLSACLVWLSITPHKEYRVIYVMLPLLAVWLLTHRMFGKKTWGQLVIGVMVTLGILAGSWKWPGMAKLYPYSLMYRDPGIKLYYQVYKLKDVCGVWDKDTPWVLSGGYYHLGKPVAWYSADYPPVGNNSYNLVIRRVGNDIKTEQLGNNCESRVTMTPYRSFPAVETYFKDGP